ncbi:MAG: class I SAM-dependent methyltransferase [Saprospiraceae bacterium]|nr:class I SAM-dependent methyltransferase [Saprospiraceae bacterium]
MKYILFFTILLTAQCACAQHDDHGHHHDANQHMNQQPFEELVAHFEDPKRDEWQKPDAVMALLGNLKGKKVMDIGSGTGYFSFRMAKAGAWVICADVDERFLDYITQKVENTEQWAASRIETRKVPFDSPALQAREVDLVLIVDTYHHIENRIDYFKEVRKGLKPEGRLVVIDFFKEESPVGPPVKMKMSEEQVVGELHKAGFQSMDMDVQTLPYQYIITVW